MQVFFLKVKLRYLLKMHGYPYFFFLDAKSNNYWWDLLTLQIVLNSTKISLYLSNLSITNRKPE